MRALLVTGVLGIGTAVVFGLAALTATLFPNGAVVSSQWNGGVWMEKGGWGGAVPMPMPVEVDREVVDPGIEVVPEGVDALPGDTVVVPPVPEVEESPVP